MWLSSNLEESLLQKDLSQEPDVLCNDPSNTLALDVISRAAIDSHGSWNQDAFSLLLKIELEADHVVHTKGVKLHWPPGKGNRWPLPYLSHIDRVLIRNENLAIVVWGPVVAAGRSLSEEPLHKADEEHAHMLKRRVLETRIGETPIRSCLVCFECH